MSKIDELLKNEKVEWKKLGESNVCLSISTGLNPRKNFKLNDSSEGELTSWYITTKDYSKNEDIEFIEGKTARITEQARRLINKRSKLEINDILFSAVGTVGKIAFVDVEPTNFDVNESTFILKPNQKNIIPKYLVHYLRSDFIQNEVKKSLKGSTLAGIRKNKLEELMIPIPSLKTQEKIVKILDKFTNYVTELQAELQARNKQYEYYRDMLLSEEYLKKLSENPDVLGIRYGVIKTTLGEIGDIKMCKRILKEQTFPQGDVPFYKIGTFGKRADSFIKRDLFNEYKEKYSYPRKGEILISASGTIGRTVIFDGNDAYFQDSNIVWIDNNEDLVLNKYLYYFYQIVNWNPSSGGTIKRLYNYNLKNIKIILPPIAIQNKVVEVLDKFQDLLSDTQGLLPEEIEQRQKQYEYYREKLLTFDENMVQASKQASKIISNSYFIILKEACSIVGLKFLDVEWKKLGDIGTFENGTGMPKSLFKKNGSVGAIHYGHIYTKYNLFVDKPVVQVSEDDIEKLKKVNYGDLVIAKTSENVEDVMKTVAYLGNETAVTGGHAAIFKHNENPKYLSYVFNGANYMLRQKSKFARGVKIIELSTTDIEKIKIPLPSLAVQEYIVSILDKFDDLINDVSKGVPKEIVLRQRQYEYYRDKLLDFKRIN